VKTGDLFAKISQQLIFQASALALREAIDEPVFDEFGCQRRRETIAGPVG